MRERGPEGAVSEPAVDQTSRRPKWLRRLIGGRLLPAASAKLSAWTVLQILGFLTPWRAAILIFSHIFDHLGPGTCGVGVT